MYFIAYRDWRKDGYHTRCKDIWTNTTGFHTKKQIPSKNRKSKHIFSYFLQLSSVLCWKKGRGYCATTWILQRAAQVLPCQKCGRKIVNHLSIRMSTLILIKWKHLLNSIIIMEIEFWKSNVIHICTIFAIRVERVLQAHTVTHEIRVHLYQWSHIQRVLKHV